MRIPALPHQKEIESPKSVSLFSRVRKIFSKRIVKKRPYVRIPPRK